MNANGHNALLGSFAVSDISTAPPDWYPDPDDPSQYRYWDGSVWTEHRAPRRSEGRSPALRSPGRLIGDSLRTLRQHWSVHLFAAASAIAAQVLAVVLFNYSADRVVVGGLDEFLARLSEPDTAASELYFESLEFDLSTMNVLPGLVGGILFWLASILLTAVGSIATVEGLRGGDLNASDVYRRAWRRLPRIFGVSLQVLGAWLLLAALLVTLIVSSFSSPLALMLIILLLLLPAFAVALLLSVTVVPIGYAVAATGPAEASLPRAAGLVRGRFWRVSGRLLLVYALSVCASFAASIVMPLFGSLTLLGELFRAAISVALSLTIIIAAAILYFELGGEIDTMTESS